MSDVLLRIGIVLYFVLVALLARIFIDDTLWLRARRRSREPGLNTVADAEQFVAEMRSPVDRLTDHLSTPESPALLSFDVRQERRLTPMLHHAPTERAPRLRTTPLVLGLKPEPVKPVRTEPVFVLESTPIYDSVVADFRRWRRAIRVPTQEMRQLFDELVERWLCSHCTDEDHRMCPGCSCSCKLPAQIGQPGMVTA